MRTPLIALAVAALLAPLAAQAQDRGDWLLRLRAAHLTSANGDGTGLGLTVSNKWIPELDVTYFFTPNLAAELILSVPQTHTVYAQGKAIGSFEHLPPTLTLQYHLTELGAVRPYVGVGLNHTRISGVNIAAGAVTLDSSSSGLALQAGFDVPLGSGWQFNVDVKKIRLATRVYAEGVDAGTLRIDPLIASVGVGLRF